MKCRVCGNNTEFREKLVGCEKDVTTVYDKPLMSSLVDIDVYICNSCNHYQINNIIPPKYYKNYQLVVNSDNDGICGNHTEPMLNIYDEKFLKLKEYAKDTSLVMDVGCGDGTLLVRLLKHFDKATGIEPSKKQAQQISKLKNERITVINDFFKPGVCPGNSIPALICVYVLEHLEEPVKFVESVYSALKWGGVAYIEVPNGQKIFGDLQYYDIFSEHINYFTAQSMLNLLSSVGFEVIEINEDFNGQNLAVYVRKAYPLRFFNDKIKKDKETLLGKINMYETVSIWGAGCKSKALIKLISGNSRIKYIFDSNATIHNKYLANSDIKIAAPNTETVNENELIVVFAINFKNEIIDSLRNKFNYKGEIYSVDEM